jgi:hypothetical protein
MNRVRKGDNEMPDQLWFYLDGRPMIKGGPITEAMKKATDGWTYYILNDTVDGVRSWRLTRWRSQVKEDLGVFPHTRGGWADAHQVYVLGLCRC